MKSTMTAVGALLASAAFTAAPAAALQYGGQPPRQQTMPQPTQGETESSSSIKTHVPKVSRGAAKAITQLQKAVEANDTAAIPEAVAAAQEAAKTPADRYMIALIQLKAAAAAKDNSAIAAAVEALLASGEVQDDEKFPLYLTLGQTYSALKQSDRAAQAFQQALQLNSGSVEATAGLAEARVAQGQTAEGLSLLQKGIALQSAGGARPPEVWYKRALTIAYNAKMPQALQIGRDWVRAYPTSANWSDALIVYQNVAQLDEASKLDLWRLKRAARSLTAGDYFNYADVAVRKGFAGEAKAVLEEGFAANTIKRSDPSFRELYALASQKTKGDRESLPASPAADATARQTLNTGDAYYGYGDYAKAVEFYRAALKKPQADANRINLHLGMALARQGDKAGASAALNAVSGPQAELAKYWIVYSSTQA